MIEIKGKVANGLGNAGRNFQQGKVEKAISKLLGVPKIVHGTLNIENSNEI